MAEDESAGVMVPPHTHIHTEGQSLWTKFKEPSRRGWEVVAASIQHRSLLAGGRGPREKKNEKAKSWLESFSHLLGHIPFP